QQRQQAITDRVPKKEDAPRPALEARSVHRVGPALADRFEQYSQLPRVIFQIGVLRDDDVAGGAGDAAPQRRALATIGRMMDHPGGPARLKSSTCRMRSPGSRSRSISPRRV